MAQAGVEGAVDDGGDGADGLGARSVFEAGARIGIIGSAIARRIRAAGPEFEPEGLRPAMEFMGRCATAEREDERCS